MELFLYLFLLSRSSGWLVGWLVEEVFSLLVLLIGSWLVGEVEEIWRFDRELNKINFASFVFVKLEKFYEKKRSLQTFYFHSKDLRQSECVMQFLFII